LGIIIQFAFTFVLAKGVLLDFSASDAYPITINMQRSASIEAAID
jgi:hypothetical protein